MEDPFTSDTTLGPLNNEDVAAKVGTHVADAVERGATITRGGTPDATYPTDFFWPATILTDVPAGAQVASEETFGPIAPLVSINSLDQAVELTNASPYGLSSAIFTCDLLVGLEFSDRVRTSLVNINESTNYWEGHVPFGGAAGTASGIGRVGGRHTMDVLTELQTVTIKG